MPLGRTLLSVKILHVLACAGCALVLAACTSVAPPTLSIDYNWTGNDGPLPDLSLSRPPQALVVRWNTQGISDARAEAVAERQCAAWNMDAKPEGPNSKNGNIVTQRYVCVASPAKVPATSQPGTHRS
jgi:hypothetical protein